MSIRIPIISEFDDKGVQRAAKEFSSLEKTSEKVGLGLEKAFVPAVAAVGALATGLGLATKAAIEDETAQEALANQLRNSTGASQEQIAAVEDAISVMSRQAAVADDKLRPAFEALVRGTKDINEAQDLMGLVLDISRAKQLDVTDVADALAKAYEGNYKAIKQLTPEMSTLVGEGADLETIINVLGGTFGGANQAFVDTAEGGMAKLNIAWSEATEAIGKAFIPILEELIPIITDMAEWVEQNSDLVVILGTAIGGLASAVVLAKGALEVYNTMTVATKTANLLLTGSFYAVEGSVIAMSTALGLVFLTVGALYELYREGPRAISEFLLPFQQFGTAIANVVILVANSVNSMIDSVLQGLNLVIKGMNKLPFVNIPEIPYLGQMNYIKLPELPALTSGISGINMREKEGGIVLPSLGGGGVAVAPPTMPGGGGGGGGGPSVRQVMEAPNMLGAGIASNPFTSFSRNAMLENITVNVNGGLATSAEIGQAVVDSIRAYNRATGPARIEVSGYV